MGRFDTTKATINANIKKNGNQEITGSILNSVLSEMVNATDEQLSELSGETIKLYPQKGTLEDGALSIEQADGKRLALHMYDKATAKNDAVFNFNAHSVLRPTENVYDNDLQQQRFVRSIIKVALKGTWQLSDVDEYYVSYFVDLGSKKQRIDISANQQGNKLRLGHFEVLWASDSGIVVAPLIPNADNMQTRNIEGYGIFDTSMFANMLNRYSISYNQGRIEIEDENKVDTNSLFTPLLKSRFDSDNKYEWYIQHFKSIVINTIPSTPIYLTRLYLTYDNKVLKRVDMAFSQFTESGSIREVAMVSESVIEKEVVVLRIQEKNDSGLNGVIVLDLRNPYFLNSHNANTIDVAKNYEITQYSIAGSVTKKPSESVGIVQYGKGIVAKNEVVQNNTTTLSFPMREITKQQSNYHILCVTPDGTIYAKEGTYGNKLYKSTDFTTWELVNRWDIYILYVREMIDGELLVFTGHNSSSDDLSDKGVYKSINNRTSWKKVITPSTKYTVWTSWSIQAYGNIVVVGEYGNFSEDVSLRGSRYLYVSRDAGNSFSIVLYMANDALFDGFVNATAHLHGACYDPYWDRLWVVTGDRTGSEALAWSDDFGKTWKGVNLNKYTGGNIENQTLQFISLYALRNCIVIAPDCPYQYMYRIQRQDKTETPIIEKAWEFRNPNAITHLTSGYKRFGASEPLLVLMGRGDNSIPTDVKDQHNFILATYDGIEFSKVWEDIGITKYPQKSVDLFKIGDKYLVDIDHAKVDSEGNETTIHEWLWLTAPQWH